MNYYQCWDENVQTLVTAWGSGVKLLLGSFSTLCDWKLCLTDDTSPFTVSRISLVFLSQTITTNFFPLGRISIFSQPEKKKILFEILKHSELSFSYYFSFLFLWSECRKIRKWKLMGSKVFRSSCLSLFCLGWVENRSLLHIKTHCTEATGYEFMRVHVVDFNKGGHFSVHGICIWLTHP